MRAPCSSVSKKSLTVSSSPSCAKMYGSRYTTQSIAGREDATLQILALQKSTSQAVVGARPTAVTSREIRSRLSRWLTSALVTRSGLVVKYSKRALKCQNRSRYQLGFRIAKSCQLRSVILRRRRNLLRRLSTSNSSESLTSLAARLCNKPRCDAILRLPGSQPERALRSDK